MNPVWRRQRELGWSDEEAAGRIGIEHARYVAIANGVLTPDPEEVEKIVDAMALARKDLAAWINRRRSAVDATARQ